MIAGIQKTKQKHIQSFGGIFRKHDTIGRRGIEQRGQLVARIKPYGKMSAICHVRSGPAAAALAECAAASRQGLVGIWARMWLRCQGK